MKRSEIIEKQLLKLGSAKSGNYGHKGRPGQVGGSAAGGGMGGSSSSGGTDAQKMAKTTPYTKILSGTSFSTMAQQLGARLTLQSSGSRGVGPGGSPDSYGAKVGKKLEAFLRTVGENEAAPKYVRDDVWSGIANKFIGETQLYSAISTAREAEGITSRMSRY